MKENDKCKVTREYITTKCALGVIDIIDFSYRISFVVNT